MLVSMVNNSNVVSNIQNREICYKTGFMVFILVSELSKRSLGFRESDVESDVQIYNRSRPKCKTIFERTTNNRQYVQDVLCCNNCTTN